MSLPPLTTAGAAYRGAWRAQDAVVDGSNFVVSIPSLVGGSGAEMVARSWDGSVLTDGPTAAVALNATAIDGGPGIVNGGTASIYTTDATILSTAEDNTQYQHFTRGNWNAGFQFAAVCGWEAWVANECQYLENGGDGSPSAYLQLDRGSSRSQRGTAFAFTTATTNMEVQGDTTGDINIFVNGGGTTVCTLPFTAPVSSGTFDGYIIGCLQRTASAAFPPGIFQYPGAVLTWSRHVLVSTPSGFLNSTDRANLLLWIGGTDFEVATFPPLFFGMTR